MLYASKVLLYSKETKNYLKKLNYFYISQRSPNYRLTGARYLGQFKHWKVIKAYNPPVLRPKPEHLQSADGQFDRSENFASAHISDQANPANHPPASRPSKRPWCGNRFYRRGTWCFPACCRRRTGCGTKRRTGGPPCVANSSPRCGCTGLGIPVCPWHAIGAKQRRRTRPAPRNICRYRNA